MFDLQTFFVCVQIKGVRQIAGVILFISFHNLKAFQLSFFP